VDVSAPNAAPEGVYKTERYAKDFAHTIPVAKGRPYHVRLHFAEEFDNGAGRRVENIAINGQPVLKDFDIFTAAGGMHQGGGKRFWRHIARYKRKHRSAHFGRTGQPGSKRQN